MKIFFIWLLVMHDAQGWHIPTAFTKFEDCRVQADELNARVGEKRGLHWSCEKQGVER